MAPRSLPPSVSQSCYALRSEGPARICFSSYPTPISFPFCNSYVLSISTVSGSCWLQGMKYKLDSQRFVFFFPFFFTSIVEVGTSELILNQTNEPGDLWSLRWSVTEKEVGYLRSAGQGGHGEISASEVRPDTMKNV